MKKNQKQDETEILKAVAQAWHSHSTTSKSTTTTSEFDTLRRCLDYKPSRFKLEAMRVTSRGKNWDFRQSLWDSYEIVAVSKKLETGLGMDDPFSTSNEEKRGGRRRRESKNSLRNLFNKISSRRFSEEE